MTGPVQIPDEVGSRKLRCAAGEVLFRPEQECPGFVIVRGGAIKVTLSAPNGREVVLYRVRPGDVCLQTFACLVEGKVYSAEGVAETELDAEIIPPSGFHRLMAEDERFRGFVFTAIAHRFAAYEQLIEDVALKDLDARLARVLLALADSDGAIVATHEALAAETASGRAVITRALGRFARDGLVTLARGRTDIVDRARLERIAAS